MCSSTGTPARDTGIRDGFSNSDVLATFSRLQQMFEIFHVLFTDSMQMWIVIFLKVVFSRYMGRIDIKFNKINIPSSSHFISCKSLKNFTIYFLNSVFE